MEKQVIFVVAPSLGCCDYGSARLLSDYPLQCSIEFTLNILQNSTSMASPLQGDAGVISCSHESREACLTAEMKKELRSVLAFFVKFN
jgi:hypothetical protein